uniref:Uncharacterized protein n=1 Tax=Zooxanthella nutricula TaxID=1333877 RepID=A0A7S2NUG5_9DINO
MTAATFAFLPSVGSWLTVPPTRKYQLAVASQCNWTSASKGTAVGKCFDVPAAAKLAPASGADRLYVHLPSVASWRLPLPLKKRAAASSRVEQSAKLPGKLADISPKGQPEKPTAAKQAAAADPPSPTATPSTPQVTPQNAASAAAGSPQSRAAAAMPPEAVGKSPQASANQASAKGAPKPGAAAGERSAGVQPATAGAQVGSEVVSNEQLKTFKVTVPRPYPGVQYRKSRNLNDRWPRYAQNDAIVRGLVEEGGEWLKLDSNIFLPMRVGTVSILQPYVPEDDATRGPGDAQQPQANVDMPGGRMPAGGAAAPAARPPPPPQQEAPWWACCSICNSSAATDSEVIVAPGGDKPSGSHARNSNTFE